MATVKKPQSDSQAEYLDGQLLIAMPTMGDPRFERAVVYLCAHSEEGAMGIVINKLISGLGFPELLDQLGIESGSRQANEFTPKDIHFGGPVETARGFVLHSMDFHTSSSSMEIGEKICLTATVDILKAMAVGDGPQHALMALGYAGWAPGQLEEEIQANGWLHCSADETLLFNTDINDKYNSALAKIGVDPSFLSSEAGHA